MGLTTGRASAFYRLGTGTVGFIGQNLWRWCMKCQGLAFSGDAPGVCPTGGTHDHTGSEDYTLPWFDAGLDLTYAAHETGHGFGLAHAWSANPDTLYGDPWDIMASGGGFANPPFGCAGPGLSAPQLHRIGWLPDIRVASTRSLGPLQAGGRTVRLTALERPEQDGMLMGRVIAADRIYTAEFRQRRGWDQEIVAEGVVLHELRSHYTASQTNWRFCPKCMSLFYAGWAACSAGGLHSPDEGFNYRLETDPAAAGQNNWRWCCKCQQLCFTGHGVRTLCPAGENHDHTGSIDYRLAIGGGAIGQTGWRWCRKCEVLTYAAHGSAGACWTGGRHNHMGSAEYRLRHDSGAPGQADWQSCRKCQALTFSGVAPCAAGGFHQWWRGYDYGVVFSTVASGGGQHGWRWCNKCQQLASSGAAIAGRCAGGDRHDYTGSAEYTVPTDGVGTRGQGGWRRCRKCHTLGYSLESTAGACSEGGVHDYSQSDRYVANATDDTTYLLGGARRANDMFSDESRGVYISVNSIDWTNGVAVVTLGAPAKVPLPH